MGRVVVVSAGAGVHGGDEHELRGVVVGGGGAGDADVSVFERLAQDLQCGAGELGELVEEEDAAVGERDLAGDGVLSAAEEADGGDGVVGGAEGAAGDEASAAFRRAGD